MNKYIKTFIILAGFGMFMNISIVKADTALCQLAIDAAQLATQGTELFGRNADRDMSKLLGKLASAELKLAEGKSVDTVAKLMDYQAAIIAMADAAKPKISMVDAYGADGIADGIGGLDGNAADAIAACEF